MSPTATSTPQLTNCVTTTTPIKSINPPTANATTKLELLPTNSTSTIIQNNNYNSCNSTINTDTNSSSTNLHHQVTFVSTTKETRVVFALIIPKMSSKHVVFCELKTGFHFLV